MARGAADARIEQLKAGSGSLGIKPEVIGPAHFDTSNTAFAPFCIGDMDPEQNFVHVLDESSLEIILTELDTVKDFTDYLTRKEVFVRSRNLKKAEAEEDILAYYATHTDQSGEHDFVPTDGKTWEESGPIEIKAGLYNEYSNDPRYIAKKAADEESYAWDKIIQVFTRHVLGGTSLSLLGFDFDLQNSEKGLRYLALESRLSRRVLGSALLGALEKGKDTDRFFRLMFSAADPDVAETAYFALTVKYLDFMKESGGYNDYRAKRASLAALYGRKTLMDRSNLKRVVGIVVEPPGSDGGSEDLVLIEQQEWTNELRAEVETDCKAIGILQGSHQEHRYHAQEFPDDDFLQVRIGDEIITLLDPPFGEDPMSSMFAEPHTSNKNRKERRAEKARARKLRKK
ncbi:MAG: hypothetical protein HRT82_16555 [Henriciella sp.]|nr:hypothetical protein [Henriciella sp.]